LISKVKKVKSDFGIAFDGDMDRVFFVDERGQDVDSSIVAGMLIDYLCVGKGGNVVYNTVMSRIVPERVKLHGGKAYKERVGHAFIKERMKKTNSIFGAESSAHYYYGDNWYADSGLITSLIICEIMSRAKKIRKKFSDIAKEYEKYYKIIEKSFRVGDKKKVMEKVEERFRKRAKRVEKKDGLTMEFSWGWFNVRASNTEPLLRLNLEAKTKGEMVRRKLELIEFIGGKI
jgi:phosphomannomutase